MRAVDEAAPLLSSLSLLLAHLEVRVPLLVECVRQLLSCLTRDSHRFLELGQENLDEFKAYGGRSQVPLLEGAGEIRSRNIVGEDSSCLFAAAAVTGEIL